MGREKLGLYAFQINTSNIEESIGVVDAFIDFFTIHKLFKIIKHIEVDKNLVQIKIEAGEEQQDHIRVDFKNYPWFDKLKIELLS